MKDIYLKKILGDTYHDVKTATVLMVGAGGIGCELLKDLILSGFKTIHIVDLDTITLLNLNRQFLFRTRDIDQSKSKTIVTAVQSFNYLGALLIPHHGNIMDINQFPILFWDKFNCIYNALDNLQARRYVNNISLLLKLPLIESGTTGFQGQVQPIYPYKSECFDCSAKSIPKTYPVCTIRSTPSQSIHCITWAKEFLFYQLFDELEKEDVNNVLENIKEQEELENSLNELIDLRNSINHKDFPLKMIQKIFINDIQRALLIEELWKNRIKPIPLQLNRFNLSSHVSPDINLWSIDENLTVLINSTKSLQKRVIKGESIIKFDKDDEDTLNFVAASSNLRSFVFNIELKSKFEIKEIAGNIIPAIATTNAIISGFSNLSGLQYFNYKNFDISNQSTVFISIKPNKYITAAKLVEPNPKCFSSSLLSRGILNISVSDLEKSLGWLINNLLTIYGYQEDGISIQSKSKLIYDPDFDDNIQSKLSSLINHGDILLIQDDNDELENLELCIQVGESTKFPDLKLRNKKIDAPPIEDEVTDAADAIIVDDDEIIDEPEQKRRKLN